MQIKNIAFVVKYFPTVSETFIVNQINGLIDKGISVSLYAYNKVEVDVIHECIEKYDLLKNVIYFVRPPKSKLVRFLVFLKWTMQHFFKIRWRLYFKTLNMFKYGKEAYTLKLFFESQWFLVSNDFEVIHAHFGMNGNRIAYVKSHLIIHEQTKLITSFHGYDLEPNKLSNYQTEYKYLFKKADAFTVNTPYLDSLLKQVNNPNIPSYILPVGLDTSYFKKRKIKTNTSYYDILFCGKLIPLKGPDIAIDVVRLLHKNGHTQVRLHIIGEGIMRDQLEKQVQRCNLASSVYFYGSQSQKDLKNHFEQADAFLLPGCYELETGRAETQGLVIQEAQAMELPVIISDVGGMKYGMLPDKSGFVIPQGNIEGFVKSIETLISKPKLKGDMGRAGRLFVEKHYDNKELIDKLLDIYQNVRIA